MKLTPAKLSQSYAFMLMALTLLLFTPPPALADDESPSATFFQLQQGMAPWKGGVKQDWKKMLDLACNAPNEYGGSPGLGYNTIIVQFVKNGDNDLMHYETRTAPDGKTTIKVFDDDMIENLLREADSRDERHKVEIFIGLEMDNVTGSAKVTSKTSLEALIPDLVQKQKLVSDRVADAYGSHQSFAGWYIPLELYAYNFKGKDDDRTKLMHALIEKIAANCRDRKRLKVALSMYQGGSLEANTDDAAKLAETYTGILDGAGVDILLPQDQAGERFPLRSDTIRSCYIPMRAACLMSKPRPSEKTVAFWPIVEVLENKGGKRFPGNIKRIKQQIQIAQDFVLPQEKIATFDFLNYQNPETSSPELPDLAERKRLFKEFQECVGDLGLVMDRDDTLQASAKPE